MGPKAHGFVAEVSAPNLDITLSLLGKNGGEVGSIVVSFDRFKEIIKDVLDQAKKIDEQKPKLYLVETPPNAENKTNQEESDDL
jgi:hypothetical protein